MAQARRKDKGETKIKFHEAAAFGDEFTFFCARTPAAFQQRVFQWCLFADDGSLCPYLGAETGILPVKKGKKKYCWNAIRLMQYASAEVSASMAF